MKEAKRLITLMQQDVCVDFKDHEKVAKPKQGLQ
jgi:hypothetical protein